MKVLFIGFILGILIPVLGVTVHTQISQLVGDTLLMPMYIMSGIFDEPFWYLSFMQKAFLFIICGLFYALVLAIIQIMPNKKSKTYN